LFNVDNPSGLIPNSDSYATLLALGISIGIVTAVKRFYIGLVLGKATCSRYMNDLKKIMRKALLIGQVATLARDMERYDLDMTCFGDIQGREYEDAIDTGLDDGTTASAEKAGPNVLRSMRSGMKSDGSTHTLIDLTTSQRAKINELLGEWEEPKAVDDKDVSEPGGAEIC